MASQRKRGPLAFRPRLLTGLALSLLSLSYVTVYSLITINLIEQNINETQPGVFADCSANALIKINKESV